MKILLLVFGFSIAAITAFAYQYGSGYQGTGMIVISAPTSIDGGSAASTYLVSQSIDGGNAHGS